MGAILLKIGFFHNLPTGGGVRVASQQLLLLSRRFEWDIHVPEGSAPFTPDPGLLPRRWHFPEGRPLTGPSRLVAPVFLYAKLAAFHRLCRRISREMSSSGCSAVLLHPSMILYAPPLLRMAESPRIFYCHEFPRHLYEKGATKTPNRFTEVLIKPLLALERRLDYANARSADFHVCNSRYISESVERIYGRKTVIIRPGVDSTVFTPGPAPASGGFVLSVGAMTPLKGHDLVIRALSLIPVHLRPPLVVAADRGRSNYAEYLEALACKFGVGLTILRGFSQSKMIESYRSAALVVCAQKAEPYGLVPLEAMACSRPVVAVDEGGFPENIRNGETGFIVARDPAAISTAIAGILSDPALARSLGDAGRQFALAERSVAAHGEAVASLIERAAAGERLF
jgi:glycosyltransferase involved in cell wall biosynthesis